MPREIVRADKAPGSQFFSQGVKAGPFVFVSGTVGTDPVSGQLAGNSIQDQTRQALANCEAILEAAGAGLGDVVEVGVLLSAPSDFAGLNEEYAVVPARPSDTLRRQARRRPSGNTRFDPDDCLHRLRTPG